GLPLLGRWNVFGPLEILAAARLVERRGNRERFVQRGECLLGVKIWVAFPARVDIEFPAHPRQCGPDQFVIDLLCNWPAARIYLFPARLELFKVVASPVDAGSRPIAASALPLHSVHVIAGDWRIFRAPGPY